MTLSQRTKQVIQDAGISPRILSTVAKVHYTTIYNLLRSVDGEYESKCRPLVTESINRSLDRIQELINSGVLPYDSGMPHKEIADRLIALID